MGAFFAAAAFAVTLAVLFAATFAVLLADTLSVPLDVLLEAAFADGLAALFVEPLAVLAAGLRYDSTRSLIYSRPPTLVACERHPRAWNGELE